MPKFEIQACNYAPTVVSTEYDALAYLRQFPADVGVMMTNLSVKAQVPELPFPVYSVPYLYPIVKFGGMDIPCGGYTLRFEGGEMRDASLRSMVDSRNTRSVPLVLIAPSGRTIGEFGTAHDFKSFVSRMLKNECLLTWYDAGGKVVERTSVCTPSDFLASEKKNKGAAHYVSLLRVDGEHVFESRKSTGGECVSYLISRFRMTR